VVAEQGIRLLGSNSLQQRVAPAFLSAFAIFATQKREDLFRTIFASEHPLE